MPTKFAGKKTIFKFNNQTLDQVSDLSLSGFSRNFIDVTTFDSPGSFREYIEGVKEVGTVSLTLVLNPSGSTHLLLSNNFQQETASFVPCEVDFAASGKKYQFSASVASLGHTVPLDDAITLDVELQTTGEYQIVS